MSAVSLRIATAEDTQLIDELDTSASSDEHWRYRTHLPPKSERLTRLWSGVEMLRLIDFADHGVVGYVCAYDADIRSGTCWIAVTVSPPYRRTGAAVVAVGQFLSSVFKSLRCRWVYMSFTSSSVQHFASLSARAGFEHLGTLKSRWLDKAGTSIDQHIYGCSADAWLRTWGIALSRYELRDATYMSALERAGHTPKAG